jgi:dTDP-4-amino-4,6-dideoxygalactose transaminase
MWSRWLTWRLENSSLSFSTRPMPSAARIVGDRSGSSDRVRSSASTPRSLFTAVKGALAERLRLLRNFGFVGYDCVTAIGTNGKMSELAAAVGLTSLDNMATIVAANRANYDCYRRMLADIAGIKLVPFDAREVSNFQYVVLEVDDRVAGLSRDELAAALVAENVLARRYFFPGCHRMDAYRASAKCPAPPLPITELLSERVLALPTGLQVDQASILRIAGIVRTAIENAPAVKSRLSQRRAA